MIVWKDMSGFFASGFPTVVAPSEFYSASSSSCYS